MWRGEPVNQFDNTGLNIGWKNFLVVVIAVVVVKVEMVDTNESVKLNPLFKILSLIIEHTDDRKLMFWLYGVGIELWKRDVR